MAVHLVVDTVPTTLTLYVVCSPWCHVDLSVNLDTWSLHDWKHRDGSPILGARTLSGPHEAIEHRESRIHHRAGAWSNKVGGIGTLWTSSGGGLRPTW